MVIDFERYKMRRDIKEWLNSPALDSATKVLMLKLLEVGDEDK